MSHVLCHIVGLSKKSQAFFKNMVKKQNLQIIDLDTFSIYPNSFQLFCGETQMGHESYQLDFSSAELKIIDPCLYYVCRPVCKLMLYIIE